MKVGQPAAVGWPLIALLVLGALGRLVLLLLTDGNGDTDNALQVAGTMQTTPLALYTDPDLSWPYPPGYTPVLVASNLVADAMGSDFSRIVRIPVIAADLGTAWLVAGELARIGRSQRDALIAAACVLLSPIYLAVAGIHGQLDSVMMLMVVAGLIAWRRLPRPYDLIVGGMLLGLAVSIKTMAVVVVLALVFAVGTLRRVAVLTLSAAAVPFVFLLPYLVTNAQAVLQAFSYRGVPGLGGLGLVVQPELVDIWLLGIERSLSRLEVSLLLAVPMLILVALAATVMLALRHRPRPELGAILLLLAVYTVGVTIALHYVIWIIPMLLLGGYIREAVWLQVALLLPVVTVYLPLATDTLTTVDAPWPPWFVHGVYVPYMIAFWLAGATAYAIGVARVRRRAAVPSS